MSIRERPFLRQVQHVHPDARDPRTAAVRQQIRRDFGMLVPPFALHLPVPDALSACWAIVREPTHGRRVDRATKEAVAAAVSATNTCPYCVDVHTTTLPRWASPPRPRPSPPGSPTPSPTRACTPWSPGRATRHSDAPILRQRPFPDEHAPELIGVALAYHYINRMVNIFAVASPFPVAAPGLKPFMKRIASPAFRGLLAREVHPGASLDLLPPAPLPDDLTWAHGDPVIAGAYGRAATAFDATGRQALPDPVRNLVTVRLTAWRGEEPGLSRGWADSALQTLPAPQRPQGRLALLAALASYQVDAHVLDDARTRPGPAGDETLIATAAWASFAAARRIGSWLHTAPATTPTAKR